mmetsp:Transcript_10387/g.29675  ORF Transcript_10387/g.29675 Transcript_10387/m.29675 type:complete len:244 (+) Transcript_10387:1130-1861(+)
MSRGASDELWVKDALRSSRVVSVGFNGEDNRLRATRRDASADPLVACVHEVRNPLHNFGLVLDRGGPDVWVERVADGVRRVGLVQQLEVLGLAMVDSARHKALLPLHVLLLCQAAEHGENFVRGHAVFWHGVLCVAVLGPQGLHKGLLHLADLLLHLLVQHGGEERHPGANLHDKGEQGLGYLGRRRNGTKAEPRGNEALGCEDRCEHLFEDDEANDISEQGRDLGGEAMILRDQRGEDTQKG